MPPKDFDKLKKTIKKTAKACSDYFEEMETALADMDSGSPDGARQSDLPPSLGPYIDQKLALVHSHINSNAEYIHDRINRLQQALYSHTEKGHLPPIEGAGRMQKALKAVGLDDDYQVQKKTIYADDGTPEGFSFLFKVKK